MPVALDRGARGIADTLVALARDRIVVAATWRQGCRRAAHGLRRSRRMRPRGLDRLVHERLDAAWQARPGEPGSIVVCASAASTSGTSAPATDTPRRALERRRNVLLAHHHRQQGWSIAEIAHLLDRAPATVRGYLHDPTGEKDERRKASYAGTCERCGTPTSGANGKGRASRYCQRCKPQSRARWTRQKVRGAHRFWLERFGFVASSVDWSGTHARQRGDGALERYRSARWSSQSVIRRLYGTPAAARDDAFPPLASDSSANTPRFSSNVDMDSCASDARPGKGGRRRRRHLSRQTSRDSCGRRPLPRPAPDRRRRRARQRRRTAAGRRCQPRSGTTRTDELRRRYGRERTRTEWGRTRHPRRVSVPLPPSGRCLPRPVDGARRDRRDRVRPRPLPRAGRPVRGQRLRLLRRADAIQRP
jgi:hypothetical protein